MPVCTTLLSEPRSSLPFAVFRCQANLESSPLKVVEGLNGVRREFVPGPIETRPPSLVDVVEGFDVLVQLLIHRRGLGKRSCEILKYQQVIAL